MAKLKILICGTGSIGKRHINNSLSLNLEVLIWRMRSNIKNDLKNFKNISIIENLDEAINRSDCVIVATATNYHDFIISRVMKFNRPIYIEKPISNKINIFNKLKKYDKKNIIHNGFQFRYHPNLIFFKRKIDKMLIENIYFYNFNMGFRLDRWRKNSNYKYSYSSKKNQGGGVILDLIHQIDIAIWYFGSVDKIICIKNTRGNYNIDVENIAHIVMKHQNGITGVINLDMLSPIYTCEFKIVTKNNVYLWDYNKGIIQNIKESSNKIINKTPKKYKRNNMFENSLKDFIDKIQKKKRATKTYGSSLQDSIESLKLAIKCKKYIK